MRIGIDARFLGRTSYGLAQYSENLLLALSRHDEENEYVVFVSAGLQRRLKVGENFRMVHLAGAPLSGKGLMRLGLALRTEKLDLMHVHFPLAPLHAPCPLLITVHDMVPFQAGEGADRHGVHFWDRVGRWSLYPRTMAKAKWIVCVSNATRDRLAARYPGAFHKTIVVPSGVEDIGRGDTREATSQLIRSRLRLPAKYVLYSGSTVASKNLHRLIQAFAMLHHRIPDARDYHLVMDLTGRLEAEQALTRIVDQYDIQDNVRILTGLKSDERRMVFAGAELFFIASVEEGFGLPALKAQLARVPVVAANAGALPEMCGDAALYADPEDVDDMVAKLIRGLFDQGVRGLMIEKGEQNAQRYSWTRTADRIRQIYELLF